MKSSKRKWLGVGLVLASLAAWELTACFGVGQDRLLQSHSYSDKAGWTATTSKYEVSLPLSIRVGLLAGVGLGILLLVMPGSENTKA
jgi:hypothetical protein